MAGPGLDIPGIYKPEMDLHPARTMRKKHFERKCYSVLDTMFHPAGRELQQIGVSDSLRTGIIKHLGYDETSLNLTLPNHTTTQSPTPSDKVKISQRDRRKQSGIPGRAHTSLAHNMMESIPTQRSTNSVASHRSHAMSFIQSPHMSGGLRKG